MNGRRVLFAFAVSLVLFCFAVQPALTALYTAPGRVVEVIPIDVEAGCGLPSKDAVEGLGIPNVEWDIQVKGVALVTAAGDAIVQASYIFKEREAGSTEWRTENGRVQTVFPKFVEYRAAVEAYKRGEIEEPLPELLHQGQGRNRDILKSGDWGQFTTYDWYGFKFVAAPGSTKQWVKYDHPDNYYTYHPEQWNLDWTMYKYHAQTMWGKEIVHFSQSKLNSMLATANLYVFAGAILGLAAFPIGFLAPPISGIIAAIAFILELIGVPTKFLIENYIMTEQGDGWVYWHFNFVYKHTLISFGALRDVGVLV